MITASHNPKRDNGYKLYWENAVQIIPPHDDGIYKSILSNLEPWGDYSLVEIPSTEISGIPLRQHMAEEYMKILMKVMRESRAPAAENCPQCINPRIAYTGDILIMISSNTRSVLY